MQSNEITIFFRCDASYEIGQGHLTRSLTLAHEFANLKSTQPVFIVHESSILFLPLIQKYGYEYEVLRGDDEGDEAEKVAAIIKKRAVGQRSVCIIDSYAIGSEYEDVLRMHNVFVCAMDDMAIRNYSADVVINYHIHAEALQYQSKCHTQFLLGPEYVILRQEFLVNQIVDRKVSRDCQNILVTMGGGTLADDVVLKVLDALKLLKSDGSNFFINVVSSANEKNQIRIREKIMANALQGEIFCNVENMAKLMNQSDMVIAAGGVTAYELAYCGTPSLLFTLGENQKKITQTFAKNRIAKDLGWHHEITPENLAVQIKELWGNFDERSEMSQCGRKIIDGHGTERIVNAIYKFAS